MNDLYLIRTEDGKQQKTWGYGTVGQNPGR